MSSNNEKNARATIADLVAADSGGEVNFFRRDHKSGETAESPVRGEEQALILDRLKQADMLVTGSRLGPGFSDEYRRIKRPLLSNAFGKSSSLVERGNLILVTSSIPGEGKTHTAVNLALSIAQERDHTVLLVDCDVTRKGVSHMMGLADRPGLVDVLEDASITIGDTMLRTDINQLTLLTAGKHHEYVTELLASQRMSRLVEEIASRYSDRVIIFDGPPLLPTPQTQVLAGLVGQVVFVIEAGKTPQAIVEEAIEMIPEETATGLVMNKSEGASERGSYYYGYYGSDRNEGKNKSKDK